MNYCSLEILRTFKTLENTLTLFSDLATEVWEFENNNSKVIGPTLDYYSDYSNGIALFAVNTNFCKK